MVCVLGQVVRFVRVGSQVIHVAVKDDLAALAERVLGAQQEGPGGDVVHCALGAREGVWLAGGGGPLVASGAVDAGGVGLVAAVVWSLF